MLRDEEPLRKGDEHSLVALEIRCARERGSATGTGLTLPVAGQISMLETRSP